MLAATNNAQPTRGDAGGEEGRAVGVMTRVKAQQWRRLVRRLIKSGDLAKMNRTQAGVVLAMGSGATTADEIAGVVGVSARTAKRAMVAVRKLAG